MSIQFKVLKTPIRCLACVVALALTSTVHAQLDIALDVSVTEVDGLFRYDYTLTNRLRSSVGVNGRGECQRHNARVVWFCRFHEAC